MRRWQSDLTRFSSRAQSYYYWLLDETSKTPAEGLAGYVIFLTEIDSRPYLKDVKCSMMMLTPTVSTACPKAESEFVKDKVEQASLVRTESLGHEIFAERLEECISVVLEFSRDLGDKNNTSLVGYWTREEKDGSAMRYLR